MVQKMRTQHMFSSTPLFLCFLAHACQYWFVGNGVCLSELQSDIADRAFPRYNAAIVACSEPGEWEVALHLLTEPWIAAI